MNKLLKFLLAFALPMYVTEGGGGGGGGQESAPLSTDSFAEMLGGGGDNGQPETDPQNVDPDQDPIEEPDPAADPDADPDPVADPDADDPADDPAEQPEKDSTEAFLELEINGEKVTVSKDEAKNGYLRQQDYTQKAQRLAQERQEWNQHVAQQAAEVQQFSQEIGQLTNIDAAIAEYQAVDWAGLRESDPVSFAAHLAEFNDLRARRGEVERGIVQKQQQLTTAQAEAQRQTFVQQSQEAAAHMAAVVPGFGKEHVGQMREFGQKVGFTAAELAQVTDKRMLEVLYKAAQYDKQQSTTQQAIKKVSALPTKAAKAAPAAKPAAQLHVEKQTRRLEQTGSVKDFAALLGMTSRK
jgi:hypothetical protein